MIILNGSPIKIKIKDKEYECKIRSGLDCQIAASVYRLPSTEYGLQYFIAVDTEEIARQKLEEHLEWMNG